jgi:hypothetical protein
MSKRTKKRALITFVTVVLFVVASFIQVPRGPAFLCSHDSGSKEKTEYRLQYGLPYVFIKRSVSDFECETKADKANHTYVSAAGSTFLPEYNTHEINYLNFIADIYIWATATYFIVKIAAKARNK